MSSFYVEPKQIHHASEQIGDLSQRIKKLNGQIETIMKQNQMQSSSYRNVRRNLDVVISTLGNEADKVRYMSNVLEEIIALYEQVEKRLISNSRIDIYSIKETAAQIRNELNEIGGILGMDSAALYSDDPVNLSNGNYVYEKVFFKFDTVISMNFRMFYNACGEMQGALGNGWLHNFERQVVVRGDTYRILSEDGNAQVFSRNQEGIFVPVSGTVGVFKQIESGWLYTDDEQITFYFDLVGKLVAAMNQDGWRIDLQYVEKQIQTVSCTDGISLHFLYDSEGRLNQLSDHAGRTVQFCYEKDSLSEVQDPVGNITKYNYDERGRLYKIISPSGELSVQNTYDERGRTVQQMFADGGIVKYHYNDAESSVTMCRQNKSEIVYCHDELFRNTKTIYSDGEELISYNDNNQRTSFTDKLGRVSKYDYDAVGRLSSFSNAMGNKMSFVYNAAGQVAEVLLEGELLSKAKYDERGHQVVNIDANGGETRFAYDALGRVTVVTHEDGSETVLKYNEQGNISCVQDPITGCTQYKYDNCHRVIRTIDALGNETQYEYDAADQLIKVVNAEGHSRSYSYDARGNLIKVVDFNGGIITIKYNSMNRPLSITDADGNTTAFEYDKMSNPIRKTAADGGITEYGYDAENRMTKIRYPMGGIETAEYDAVGNLIKRCAADGGEYSFVYDALDRPVSVMDPVKGVRSAVYDKFGNVTSICYEDGSKESFTYDLMGNRLSHTDQKGYTRTFKYNALSKVTEIRDEEGVLVQFHYGPGGQLLREQKIDGETLTYTYDIAGNVVRIEDSVRGVWNYQYNSLGQVCQAEHVGEGTENYVYDMLGNISVVIDGEGNKTAYQYSKGGALEKVIDARGTETAYRYDPCYRLQQIFQPESGCFSMEQFDDYNKERQNIRTTAYEWDLDGNMVSAIDSMGVSTLYTYDACGRIISKQDQDGNITTCSYRKDGTEETLAFSDGRTIKYQYDALKRLSQIEDWLGVTRINRDAVGRVVEVIDHEGNNIGYTWNDRGQCVKLSYPDGHVVSYEYDKSMRLSRCISDKADIQYKYYENGQLCERQFSNDLHIKYSYDKAGRISSLTHSHAGTEMNKYSYTYDACSRKNRMIEQHGNEPKLDYQFSYDKLGCLTSVIKNGQAYQNYEYDVFGNRSKMWKNGQSTTYGYDKLNRLQWSRTEDEEKTYTYDRRGNLASETVNGVQRLKLHFDALNRVTKAVSDRGESNYIYNGMAMLTNIQTLDHGYSMDERLLFDYAGKQNTLLASKRDGQWENFIWDRELLFSGTAGENTYFLNDEKMSNSGTLFDNDISRYEYDVFGGTEKPNLVKTKFGFTGYRHDAITEYYDGGWRQYDPSIGRFISPDPVAGTLLMPITLNPYLYCLSDPVNYSDPTGRIVAWLAGGIVGAVVNVGVKFAGDVVNSVKNGEWTGSSWQSYVGTAAGGFVQGSVFVVAGPTAAGAAGGATETFITNGLNMVTGQEGYRKEDGYNFGNLVWDTGVSATEGAIAGFTFGQASKYIKIPGITSGRGSAAAVWKQVMTKAQRGLISNVSLKTLWKGLMSYGLVKTLDTMLDKGIETVKDGIEAFIKKQSMNLIGEMFQCNAKSDTVVATGLRELLCMQRNATCATA